MANEVDRIIETLGRRDRPNGKPWCMKHQFLLDKGVCVGCEAVQAIDQYTNQRLKSFIEDLFENPKEPEPTLDEILEDAYRLGRTDVILKSDDYNTLMPVMKQRAQDLLVKELRGLLEYNGSYIGMDGRRVDNMVHHDVIREAIKRIKGGSDEAN